MRTYLGVLLIFTLVAGRACFAAKEDSLDQLIARADAAKTEAAPAKPDAAAAPVKK